MNKWAGSVFVMIGVAAAGESAHAQWLNYKTTGVPRTANGTLKLDAPPPRAADGHSTQLRVVERFRRRDHSPSASSTTYSRTRISSRCFLRMKKTALM